MGVWGVNLTSNYKVNKFYHKQSQLDSSPCSDNVGVAFVNSIFSMHLGNHYVALKLTNLLCFRFMRQVQDETLRLSTLGPWTGRQSDKDVSVCGYLVPAGTPIICALGVSLKNTTQWKDEEK